MEKPFRFLPADRPEKFIIELAGLRVLSSIRICGILTERVETSPPFLYYIPACWWLTGPAYASAGACHDLYEMVFPEQCLVFHNWRRVLQPIDHEYLYIVSIYRKFYLMSVLEIP